MIKDCMHLAKTSKVLIVTYQDIHHSDRPSNGGKLRAYSLGEALKERGHRGALFRAKALFEGISGNPARFVEVLP